MSDGDRRIDTVVADVNAGVTGRRRTILIQRRWLILIGVVVFLLVANATRPMPIGPPLPDLPAPARIELAPAFAQATEFVETVKDLSAKPIASEELKALNALERVLRRRPDLVEFFARPDGLNVPAILDWSIVESDSDTTLLLPYRTSLRRVRLLLGP